MRKCAYHLMTNTYVSFYRARVQNDIRPSAKPVAPTPASCKHRIVAASCNQPARCGHEYLLSGEASASAAQCYAHKRSLFRVYRTRSLLLLCIATGFRLPHVQISRGNILCAGCKEQRPELLCESRLLKCISGGVYDDCVMISGRRMKNNRITRKTYMI